MEYDPKMAQGFGKLAGKADIIEIEARYALLGSEPAAFEKLTATELIEQVIAVRRALRRIHSLAEESVEIAGNVMFASDDPWSVNSR